MAEQTYEYTVLAAITCNECVRLKAGDTVDIELNQVLIPALPASIRGVIQLVDDLTYTIQYDDADLGGAAAALDDSIVVDVTCVDCLTLAQEYADALDAAQLVQINTILTSLAALGVVPGDGSDQFIVHPSSTPGVSVEVVRHDKITVAKSGGSQTIVIDPADLATALTVVLASEDQFRIKAEVSAISEKSTDNRDSAAEFLMVGAYNDGATVSNPHLSERDAVTITGVKVGNNLHISCSNNSSGDIEMFVTSKFRILA